MRHGLTLKKFSQGLAEGTGVKEKAQDYTKANMHQKPGCVWNVGKGLE